MRRTGLLRRRKRVHKWLEFIRQIQLDIFQNNLIEFIYFTWALHFRMFSNFVIHKPFWIKHDHSYFIWAGNMKTLRIFLKVILALIFTGCNGKRVLFKWGKRMKKVVSHKNYSKVYFNWPNSTTCPNSCMSIATYNGSSSKIFSNLTNSNCSLVRVLQFFFQVNKR